MYHLKRSYCLSKDIFSQWKTVNLNNEQIPKIVKSHREIILVLENDKGNEVFFDFLAYPSLYKTFSECTFKQWLEVIPLDNVNFIEQPNLSKIAYVSYHNLEQLGYYFSNNFPSFIFQPKYKKERDLLITRHQFKTMQYQIDSNCLITLNGIIHRTASDASYTVLLQGLTTAKHANRCTLGLLNFSVAGILHKYYPNFSSIRAIDGENLFNGFEFDVYRDHEGFGKFFVFAGWLITIEENVFEQVGPLTYRCYPKGFNFLERLKASLDVFPYMEDNSLLEGHETDDDFLSSNEVIEALFKLHNTFITYHSGNNFKIKSEKFFEGNFPREIKSYSEPVNPLVSDNGIFLNYLKDKEKDVWYYRLIDPSKENFTATTKVHKSFLDSFWKLFGKKVYSNRAIHKLLISNQADKNIIPKEEIENEN